MTPTPIGGLLAASDSPLWVLAIVLGVVGALLLAGMASRARNPSGGRMRRAGGRAAVSFDAVFAPGDRRDALQYILEEQHQIVMEEERGDDDPDQEPPSVIFEYPGEINGDQSGTR